VARGSDGWIADRALPGREPRVGEPAFEHGAFAGRERRHHERARRRLGRVTHGEPLHERRRVAVGAEQVAERGGIGEGVGARGWLAVEQRGVAARATMAGARGTPVEEQRLHLAREAAHEVRGQVGGSGGRGQGNAARGSREEEQRDAARPAGDGLHGAGG
jgi:hypothetical protein